MRNDLTSILMVVLAGINAYFVLRKSRDPRELARQAFRRAKSGPIGQIKDGEWVKVTGTVGAVGAMMTSPSTGRECIGFWSEVDSVDQNTVVTKKEGRCGPFSVSDDTGQVIALGPFMLTFGIEQERSPAPKDVEFLQRIGMAMDGVLKDGKVREVLLRPGDRVSVFGLAFLEPDAAAPAAGLRSPGLVRHLRGSDDRPIVLGPW